MMLGWIMDIFEYKNNTKQRMVKRFRKAQFAAMFSLNQWAQFRPSVSRQNWCSRSKNQFDDSKPEWLAQELGLRRLQRMKQICAEPTFFVSCPLTRERKEALLAGCSPSDSPTSLIYHGNLFLYLTFLLPSFNFDTPSHSRITVTS